MGTEWLLWMQTPYWRGADSSHKLCSMHRRYECDRSAPTLYITLAIFVSKYVLKAWKDIDLCYKLVTTCVEEHPSWRVRGVLFLAGAYLLIRISNITMGHTQPRDYKLWGTQRSKLESDVWTPYKIVLWDVWNLTSSLHMQPEDVRGIYTLTFPRIT